MSGYIMNLALIGLLILLNAVFAGSEMALISVREGQLRQLERAGGARALRLVALARDPNRFLATIQIGITLAGFLASATAAVSLAEPLVPALAALGPAAKPVAIAAVTLVLTYLTLVLGELAPKRLAMQKALPWALLVARPLDLIAATSRPVIALLSVSTNVVVRLGGGRTDLAVPEPSTEELCDLIMSHRGLNPNQREIIGGALQLHDRMLREVLVPRLGVFFVRGDATIDEARASMAAAGHSRAPVTRGNDLDEVLGVVHWSSLTIDGDEPVRAVVTPALALPDTVRIPAAIKQFKVSRQQLALVMNEYGIVSGIVTLEDLLEEIVGEIYDETDSDMVGIRPEKDGSMVLPGVFPMHDLVDLGVEIETPRSSSITIGGYVVQQLGRIPERPGDVVDLGPWQVEVLEVAHHAVTQVRLNPPLSQRMGPG